MSEKKTTVTYKVYPVFPRNPEDAAPGQFTYDQVKKYLSNKPIRRQPRRNKDSAASDEGGKE